MDANTIRIISSINKQVRQEALLIVDASGLEDYPDGSQFAIDDQKRSRERGLLGKLTECKPVPEKVLADYPELKSQFEFERETRARYEAKFKN